MHRREFLQGLSSVALILAVPRLWATWPQQAFFSESIADVLRTYFSGMKPEASDLIQLKIPSLAENGAVVPVNVATDIKQVEAIAIIVQQNPFPLSAVHEFREQSLPFLSLRLKLAESSKVMALVYSQNRLYMKEKFVEVTIG